MTKLEKNATGIWELIQFIAFLLIIPGLIIWLWYLIFQAPLIEKVVYLVTALGVSIAFGFITWPF
jgi:hypothetical protein